MKNASEKSDKGNENVTESHHEKDIERKVWIMSHKKCREYFWKAFCTKAHKRMAPHTMSTLYFKKRRRWKVHIKKPQADQQYILKQREQTAKEYIRIHVRISSHHFITEQSPCLPTHHCQSKSSQRYICHRWFFPATTCRIRRPRDWRGLCARIFGFANPCLGSKGKDLGISANPMGGRARVGDKQKWPKTETATRKFEKLPVRRRHRKRRVKTFK